MKHLNNSRPIFTSCILFFCFCQSPNLEDFESLFKEWFINPTLNNKNRIVSLRLPIQKLDSLVSNRQLRQTPGGAYSCILHDKDGTEYTLGYSIPEASTDSLLPLLIYLHGGIGTTRNDKGIKAYEMFHFITDTIDLFLASPSGNRSALWWSDKGLKRILKTIRYMTYHYPIDPDRIFLAGVSDGAAGCFAAANAVPGPFAGFITISGYGGILMQRGVELHPQNLMQRRIYNVNAGKDRLYKPARVKQFMDWLSQNGVAVKQQFYPEENHGFEYREREKKTFAEIITTWRKPERSTISWNSIDGVANRADNLLKWAAVEPGKKSRINAYWNNDTLIAHVSGIRSFLIISKREKNDNLFYRTDKKRIKKLKPFPIQTSVYLDVLQHYCYADSMKNTLFYIETE